MSLADSYARELGALQAKIEAIAEYASQGAGAKRRAVKQHYLELIQGVADPTFEEETPGSEEAEAEAALGKAAWAQDYNSTARRERTLALAVAAGLERVWLLDYTDASGTVTADDMDAMGTALDNAGITTELWYWCGDEDLTDSDDRAAIGAACAARIAAYSWIKGIHLDKIRFDKADISGEDDLSVFSDAHIWYVREVVRVVKALCPNYPVSVAAQAIGGAASLSGQQEPDGEHWLHDAPYNYETGQTPDMWLAEELCSHAGVMAYDGASWTRARWVFEMQQWARRLIHPRVYMGVGACVDAGSGLEQTPTEIEARAKLCKIGGFKGIALFSLGHATTTAGQADEDTLSELLGGL